MAIDSRGGRRSSASLFADGAIGRLNDMAVDPAGRLLVGSMTLGAELGSECLWQVDDDGSLVVLDDDLTISNGLGWSPDGRTLYSVDSTPGRVHRREYDPATGRVGRRRLFVDFAELDGEPDGLAVDAAGCVWIACWGAGQVLGFDPMGKVVDGVTVDARLTTSCAFVGGDLSTMFITTANKEKPGGSLHAGCNFAIAMPTPGLPPVPWEVPTKFMLHSV